MGTWVSADPGEDTGWAVWEDAKLVDAGTCRGWEFVDYLDPGNLFNEGSRLPSIDKLDRLVIEDWALYPWMAESLSWDRQETVRIIGALELLARQHGSTLVFQPASIKQAAEAAGATEYFLRPLKTNRHANDAIRHGIHYQTMQSGAGTSHPTRVDPTAATGAQDKPGSPSRAVGPPVADPPKPS